MNSNLSIIINHDNFKYFNIMENTQLFDLQYFIDKFTKVDKLITNKLKDSDGDCCALGLCNSNDSQLAYFESKDTYTQGSAIAIQNREATILAQLIKDNTVNTVLINHATNLGAYVYLLNDSENIYDNQGNKIGEKNRYIEGDSPKQRILNALHKIKNGEKI